jgi:hypothetical protein
MIKMTAQIGDRFRLEDTEYSVVAISNPIKFDPRVYGITPVPVCTACRRGYWCVYNITEEGIFLEDLYINSKDDYYPEINGVLPVYGDTQENRFEYMGHHLYKGLHLKLNYDGKILVGREFLQEYYIHMGYQRAWSYKILKEFVFLDGELVEINDQSKMAEKLRNIINENKNFDNELRYNIADFVSESFSLDYDKKAWWL